MSTVTRGKNSGAASVRTGAGESARAEIKPDLIRRRAYEIFQTRNGGPGDEASDWAQAERELIAAGREPPTAVRPGRR